MKEIDVTKIAQVSEDGKVSIPYTVSIRLVHSKSLKAVAKIEYAGVIINDIYIIDKFGRISIRFPYKIFEDKKTGQSKRATVASPSIPNISREFNQAIVEAYSEACEKELMTQEAA